MTEEREAYVTRVKSSLGVVVRGAAAVAASGCGQTSAVPVQLSLMPYAGTALRTVNVMAGGQVTPYILDTGAGFSVIDVSQIADAGCAPFGQVTGFRADGQKLTMSRCGPLTLGIGNYAATGEVATFDLRALLGSGAPQIGGLIGMASFADQAVTFDFAHERLIVETPRSLVRRIRGMHRIHLRIVRGAGGDVVPFIEVRAKTGTLWLEIDSGNDGPVFLSPHALDQLGVQLAKGSRTNLSLDVVGLGDVSVAAAPRDMIYDGQLNPAFLRQIVLSTDFAHQQAWAKLAPAVMPSSGHGR